MMRSYIKGGGRGQGQSGVNHSLLSNWCVSVVDPRLPFPGSDLLVRLVSVDLHTFGPDALTAVRLIEHQANAEQAAEVRPQLVEQVPAAVQGAPAPGKTSS